MKRNHQCFMNVLNDEEDNDEDLEITEDQFDDNQISKEDFEMVKEILDVAIKTMGLHSLPPKHNTIHNLVQPNRSANDNFGRKYLVWNRIGTITSTEEELNISNKIRIHFHDTMGKNKDASFCDLENFTLASLSLQGAIYANEVSGDETSGQRTNLLYHPFSGHENNLSEKIRIRFEGNEKASLVATGTGWFAVATSNDLLRIFSTTGISLRTVLVGGRAVCLCGCSSKLGVVYHAKNSHTLLVDILEISNDTIGTDRIISVAVGFFLPLSENSILLWAGFSDLLMLTVVDTNGKVFIMSKTSVSVAGWCWSPILDLTNEVNTRYWVIGVHKNGLSYIPLSDGHIVPQRNHNQSYPTPIVKKIRIPLLDFTPEDYLSPQKLSDFAWETIVLTHIESLKGDLCSQSGATWRVNLMENLLQEQETKVNKLLLDCAQKCIVNKNISRALGYLALLRRKDGFDKGLALGVFHKCSEVIDFVKSILQEHFSDDEKEYEPTTNTPEKQASSLSITTTTNELSVTHLKSVSNNKHEKPTTIKSTIPTGPKNPFATKASPPIPWQHALKTMADDLRITPKPSKK